MCFFRTPCHRGKNGRHDLPCRRAGATPRTFWAAESRKSGVAPARFDNFFQGDFQFVQFCISPLSKDFGSFEGEEVGNLKSAGRNSYLLHPEPSPCAKAARTTQVSKWMIRGWSFVRSSWWIPLSLTRPFFHPRYRPSNLSPVKRLRAWLRKMRSASDTAAYCFSSQALRTLK